MDVIHFAHSMVVAVQIIPLERPVVPFTQQRLRYQGYHGKALHNHQGARNLNCAFLNFRRGITAALSFAMSAIQLTGYHTIKVLPRHNFSFPKISGIFFININLIKEFAVLCSPYFVVSRFCHNVDLNFAVREKHVL